MTDTNNLDECTIRAIVPPAKIDFLNKVMEGYDNIAVVTTVDGKKGEVLLRGVRGQQILHMLQHMPFDVNVIDAQV